MRGDGVASAVAKGWGGVGRIRGRKKNRFWGGGGGSHSVYKHENFNCLPFPCKHNKIIKYSPIFVNQLATKNPYLKSHTSQNPNLLNKLFAKQEIQNIPNFATTTFQTTHILFTNAQF